MLLGFITLFIIGCIGGVCNYYISALLENIISLYIQNYIIIVLAILIQFDNIQLLNELKTKIDETDKYIRVIGDNALEIQEGKINIYKLNEQIKIKNIKIQKRNSF
jgi:hypothetical protein